MRVDRNLNIIEKYNKGDTVNIFTNTKLIKNLIKIETINDNLEYAVFYEATDAMVEEVNNTSSLIKASITLPDYECFCIISFNGNRITTTLSTNSSYLKNVFFFIKPFNPINEDISYNLINPLGDLLSTSNLLKLDQGTQSSNINNSSIYYADFNQYIEEHKYCIIELENSYYNITPIDIDTDQNVNIGEGEYILQPDRFQMIAIPRLNANIDYFINLVQEQMGKDSTFDNWTIRDVLPVIKSYPSNLNSFNKYQVYVPTVSNESAKFDLMQQDGELYEIVPFFIKTGKYTNNIKIKWSS